MRKWKVAWVLAMLLCGPVLAADGARAGDDPFLTHGPEEPTEDAELGCTLVLEHMRSQLNLYKQQHNGQYPTTNGLPDATEWKWELLTRKTKDDRGREIGPYLYVIPVNPVAKSSRVVGRREAGAGWLLEEGRIYALDQNGEELAVFNIFNAVEAAVSIGMWNETQEARTSATRSMQQTIAEQVALYKLQHGGRYPTTSGKPVAAEWKWEMLTEVTTEADGRKLGPYLVSVPVNPLTNSSKVVAWPEKGAGWHLSAEGYIRALAAEGKVLK